MKLFQHSKTDLKTNQEILVIYKSLISICLIIAMLSCNNLSNEHDKLAKNTSMDSTKQSEPALSMVKNQEMKKNKEEEIKKWVHNLYQTYDTINKRFYLGSGYSEATGRMFIEHKKEYLNALVESKMFSESFIDRLKTLYTNCENDLDEDIQYDHLTCLESDILLETHGKQKITDLSFSSFTFSGDTTRVNIQIKYIVGDYGKKGEDHVVIEILQRESFFIDDTSVLSKLEKQ